MFSETILPVAAAEFSAAENEAEPSCSLVLTASRTRWPGAVSRMQTVAVVDVRFPLHAPLTKGETVCASPTDTPASNDTSPT